MRRTLGGLMNTQWLTLAVCCQALPVQAADGSEVFGIPVEFILFAATLLGVALFHHRVLKVALTGLVVIALYKIAVTGFRTGAGSPAWAATWRTSGCCWSTCSACWSASRCWRVTSRTAACRKCCRAAAGELARAFRPARHHLGSVELPRQHRGGADRRHRGGQRLQAPAACRLSGGHRRRFERRRRRSVIGDTTTTMMWIAGVSPLDVTHAYSRRGGAGGVRHPGCAAAARSPADRAQPAGCATCRLGAGRHRRFHAGAPSAPTSRSTSGSRRPLTTFPSSAWRCGWHCCWRCRCASRNGACCRTPSRAPFFCWRW
jgi:hypothetical protein